MFMPNFVKIGIVGRRRTRAIRCLEEAPENFICRPGKSGDSKGCSCRILSKLASLGGEGPGLSDAWRKHQKISYVDLVNQVILKDVHAEFCQNWHRWEEMDQGYQMPGGSTRKFHMSTW